MTGHDNGVYVLQVYASIAGQDPQTVLSNFIAKYGDDEVTALGNLAQNVNIQAAMKSVAKGNLSSNSPSRVDLNQALLDEGAAPSQGVTGVINAVESGVSESVSEAATFSLSALKWISIGAVVIGVGYLAWELGWITHAGKKLRAK